MSFCSGCASCAQYPGCPRAERAALVNRDVQKWIGYIGTFFFMVGALAVSMSPTWSGHPGPFVVFLIGHLLWWTLGYLSHERPLLVLNGLYIALDIWALAVRW